MVQMILLSCLLFLTIAIFACLYRVIKGPSMPDRVMALDLIGINVIASVAILSMITETTAFIEVILLIGILSFVGTIALSRFIERGFIIERDRDR